MTLMSTRHFIQNNKNLKSQKPIVVIKGEQFISGNTSHWCPVYILNIFHLSFIIRPTKCVLIKSSLIGDNLKEYTDAAVIKDSQLYNFILILMSNIDNIIADASYEMKVKAEIVDFMTYFNQRMEFKCLINSPFFQIGYISSIGLVFKQTRRGVSMVNVVGRPIVTMGPFNVGVFGYIHKKMSNDENRREVQNWFKEAYELSKHSNKNQLTVISYDWTIGEIAKSPEEVTVMLFKALLKDYCISEEVFKSVCQYVNDPIEQKRDLGANKCNEVSHPGGDFDGDTYNTYNFLEMEIKLHDKAYAAVVNSCESVSPNPRIKDTKTPKMKDYDGTVVNFETNVDSEVLQYASTKSKLTVFMDSVLPEHSSDFFVRIDFLDFMQKAGSKSKIIESIKKWVDVFSTLTLKSNLVNHLPASITIAFDEPMNKSSELVVKLVYNGNGLQGITEEFFKKEYISFDRQTVLKDIVEAFDEKNNYSVLTNKLTNRIKEYMDRKHKVAMAASHTKTASTMDDIISMASVVEYIKNNCAGRKVDFVYESAFKESAHRCTRYLFDSHQLKKAFHKPMPTCDKVEYMLVESCKTDTMYVDYILLQDGRPILRNNELSKVLEKIISIINN